MKVILCYGNCPSRNLRLKRYLKSESGSYLGIEKDTGCGKCSKLVELKVSIEKHSLNFEKKKVGEIEELN